MILDVIEAVKLAIDFDEWTSECEKSGGNLNEQRKEERDKLLQKLRDRQAYKNKGRVE